MPNAYSNGFFSFVLESSSGGVYYYRIIHSSGRIWDYHHPFTSIEEMDNYSG